MSRSTIFDSRIGYDLGNKFDIGDTVYLVRYNKRNSMRIYKTTVTDIEKEYFDTWGAARTRWHYSLKGFKENCWGVPRFFEDELFKSVKEMKDHYWKQALKDAQEQNHAWDTQQEFTGNQCEYTAFGIKLHCSCSYYNGGALVKDIIDLT